MIPKPIIKHWCMFATDKPPLAIKRTIFFFKSTKKLQENVRQQSGLASYVTAVTNQNEKLQRTPLLTKTLRLQTKTKQKTAKAIARLIIKHRMSFYLLKRQSRNVSLQNPSPESQINSHLMVFQKWISNFANDGAVHSNAMNW